MAACVYNPGIRRSTSRQILDASAQGRNRGSRVWVCIKANDVQSESGTLAPSQPCREPSASDHEDGKAFPGSKVGLGTTDQHVHNQQPLPPQDGHILTAEISPGFGPLFLCAAPGKRCRSGLCVRCSSRASSAQPAFLNPRLCFCPFLSPHHSSQVFRTKPHKTQHPR